MAIKRGVLYLYGGMFEDGDKQLTLDDFYTLDLNKLEEWQTIVALKSTDLEWFESESEDDGDDDNDDDDDDNDDDDEGMEEDSEGDAMDTD
ncbi:kelch domain-containing protein 4 [Cherax quadricarinatus]|uniref:kelch domain-containing protein 4 n=1 Tax=Cherax quadricarinatus TaxID=27406 RepID=UPI00387E7D5D